MEKVKYYSIGQAAKICKIPIQTLRYYDEIKLLVPSLRKEKSNYRYYSANQLVTGFIIRQLRLIGLGLKDIKKIVDENTATELKVLIDSKLNQLAGEIAELQKIHEETEIFAARIQKGTVLLEGQKGEGQDGYALQDIPEIYLYGDRKVIESYKNEEVNLERWIAVNEEARENNLKVCGPIFVTYYTELLGQLLATDCDLEFSIQVEPGERNHKKIHKYGGFTAATGIHVGDYDTIFKTYIGLKRWIEEGGYEVVGPATEEFIISPIDINNKEEHVTKIIVPVEKK
ncbi:MULTISPECIES: MerR family transcriptional regulator [Eubacterium]|uniref:DNA-binding transcriptional regulator, MerR family n=2 Tax=Eubacterium TaxID=1730 RepID=A0A1H4AVK0_9FIRM|nr:MULTISPECIES: MerR family transcriptional regulator [Eubacterium]SDY03677.1 DNA-binding transcriptional regulator, MerR family [Eubacterium barkeri]SEA39903.1 DNA-binding transcriptional regulator, MerR family [Eubacterium aggregans]